MEQVAATAAGTLYNTEAADNICRGVSIDTRSLKPGELFVAIRGARLDGHEFVAEAIARGAAGVVVDRRYPRVQSLPGTVGVVAVPDTHRAMIQLAGTYRDSLPTRFVGITGSNGKTTTKEFAYRLLQALGVNSYRSPGNYNNLFGVPLALLAMPQDAAAAVLELGISTRSEMPQLADLVHPDVAVFTNVGASHLQAFLNPRGVARAKLELARRAGHGVAIVVNADDPILFAEARNVCSKLTTFGLTNEAHFRPESVTTEEDGASLVVIEGNRFRVRLPGRHQVYNLIAAYASVRCLGYTFNDVDTEAIDFESAPLRGQVRAVGGVTFVMDCYNANPDSVRAGLDSFAQVPADGARVVVLGDMLELGSESLRCHRSIGRYLAETKADRFLLVGPMAREMLNGAREAGLPQDRISHLPSVEAAARELRRQLNPGDHVFLKASRGIGLERVVDLLEEKRENE